MEMNILMEFLLYGRMFMDTKKELDIAIKKQLDKIAHSTLLGLSNVPAIGYAKKLSKLHPKI